MSWAIPVILVLGGQKQEDLGEVKGIWAAEQVPGQPGLQNGSLFISKC